MALKEKITQEDLYLLEIIKNPVLCTEFIQNFDKVRYEEPFELTPYQKEMMCDFNPHVSLCSARAVGKCSTGDSKILNILTGEYKTIKDLFNSTEDIYIPSIVPETFKQLPQKAEIFPNGKKECLKITTSRGYTSSITYNHPILTSRGFTESQYLKIGDYIAIEKEIPYFGLEDIPEEEVLVLAHFIAEGTVHTGSITTTEDSVIKDIYKIASYFDCHVRKEKLTYHIVKNRGLLNKYRICINKQGILHSLAKDKQIPQLVFRLTKNKLALFLNRLFTDDGWCIDSVVTHEIGYCSASENITRSVQHLLSRFGISSAIGFKKNKCAGAWWLSIKGIDNLSKFKKEIGFNCEYKNDHLESNIKWSLGKQNQANILPIPSFKNYRKKRKTTGDSRIIDYYPTRNTVSNITNIDVELQKFIDADINWVRVKHIENIGEQETYGISVDINNTHLIDGIWSHNTVSLSSLIIWALVYKLFPNDYIIFTVPNKVHLEPVFTNLIRMLRSNNFLKNFIRASGGINSSDFTIDLLNGAKLMCRIAGTSGTGGNVIGLHTPYVFLDEAGYYPWGTWIEMQPIVNTWTKGYRMIVSGVPTGLREKNVLYAVDQEDSSYTKHRIPAFDNPRFSPDDQARAEEQYGGKESDDYLHFVLGLHGHPVYALFDRGNFEIGNDEVIKLTMNGLEIKDDIAEYYTRIRNRIPVVQDGSPVLIGVDLGYTEPTAIIIMKEDRHDKLHFYARIRLEKVSYPVQEKLIDFIDTRFKPTQLGIDKGNIGIGIVQALQDGDQYIQKKYKDRLIPVDFSSSTFIGFDADGTELKQKTKPLATSVLQDFSNQHKIVYSSMDPEMITELERMTYSKSVTGEITYKTMTARGGSKGEDHFTSALLCATLAYYLTHDFTFLRTRKPKLIGFSWMGA